MWTIYDRPLDYPDGFIARLFLNDRPTDKVFKSKDIDNIRLKLKMLGKVKIPRHRDDPPSVVEIWM